jgi:hypothetical protein
VTEENLMNRTIPTAQDAADLARQLGMAPATADIIAEAVLERPAYEGEGVTWHGTHITAPLGADYFELTPALQGPLCGAHDHVPACEHDSCNAVADEAPWADECWKGCGWQHVTDAGSGRGFAGGAVYWTVLECGHTLMDESGDAAAAR